MLSTEEGIVPGCPNAPGISKSLSLLSSSLGAWRYFFVVCFRVLTVFLGFCIRIIQMNRYMCVCVYALFFGDKLLLPFYFFFCITYEILKYCEVATGIPLS